MRVIVMFDLPVTTYLNRKEYSKFRKYLVSQGFIMMQESIYSKLVQNQTAADVVLENIKKNKPSNGLVQVMKITEKQYSRIECIVGKNTSEIINTNDRIVIL